MLLYIYIYIDLLFRRLIIPYFSGTGSRVKHHLMRVGSCWGAISTLWCIFWHLRVASGVTFEALEVVLG